MSKSPKQLVELYHQIASLESSEAEKAYKEFQSEMKKYYRFIEKSQAFDQLIKHKVPEELEVPFADTFSITKDVVDFNYIITPTLKSQELLSVFERFHENSYKFIIPHLPEYIQMSLLQMAAENKFTNEKSALALYKYCSYSLLEESKSYRHEMNIKSLNELKEKTNLKHCIECKDNKELKHLFSGIRGKKNVIVAIEDKKNNYCIACQINKMPGLLKHRKGSINNIILLNSLIGKCNKYESVDKNIVEVNEVMKINDAFDLKCSEDKIHCLFDGNFVGNYVDMDKLGYNQFGFESNDVECNVTCLY